MHLLAAVMFTAQVYNRPMMSGAGLYGPSLDMNTGYIEQMSSKRLNHIGFLCPELLLLFRWDDAGFDNRGSLKGFLKVTSMLIFGKIYIASVFLFLYILHKAACLSVRPKQSS